MTVTFPSSYQLTRPPRNDDELYSLVQALWNVTIPRGKHCPHHQAPFDAFATAFFAREPQVLVRGSRGLSGKTQMMSCLGLTQAVVLGADNNIVGGSEMQAINALEHMKKMWSFHSAPKYMIRKDQTTRIELHNDAVIRPLTASERSVRGPHPQRLLLDEIDEMDENILESAKGQPMPQDNWLGVRIPQQTTMVSTLQYADGTMMKEMARFEDEGLPVMEWSLAEGTQVTTQAGIKNIEDVLLTDKMLTRGGWKPVQHVSRMGYKTTISIQLSNGKTLRLTPEHKVATPSGWARADSLEPSSPVLGLLSDARTAVPAVVTGGHVGIFRGVLMVPGAVRACQLCGDVGCAEHVRPMARVLQVAGVDTSVDSTQVVDLPIDGADETGVGQPMGLGMPPGLAVDDPVAVLVSSSDPQPTAVHVDRDGLPYPSLTTHTVLGISHGATVPVWDIGVEEDHEFVAEGVVVHNCYLDTMYAKDGWLSEEFVTQKKREVSRERWRVEYELGEPSIGNRAFDSSSVEQVFSLPCPEPIKSSREWEEYKTADPKDDRDYVIAADWAQAVDKTVISVWDVTYEPIEMVYFVSFNRLPYPKMIGKFNDLQKRYRAQGIHDATGLGRVVSDLIDGRVRDFVMAGRERDDMLSEYVTGVENGKIVAPRIGSMYRDHLYASVEDLYSRGKDYHLPDSVCSAALAWKLVSHKFPVVSPVGLPRTDTTWMARQIEQGTEHLHGSSHWRPEGDVRSTETEDLSWQLS